MADVTVKSIDELDRYQGESKGGQFLYAGKTLGVQAWGLNVLRLPPDWADYPEHDHAADGQEEVYVVLEGSARLLADGESWSLGPGTLARVGPAQKRTDRPGSLGGHGAGHGGRPRQGLRAATAVSRRRDAHADVRQGSAAGPP